MRGPVLATLARMSMLPRSYLDTTVAIENAYPDDESTRFRTIGTGFFIGLDYGDRSPSGGDTYRLLMVTNRHVVAGKNDLIIRVNRRGGSARHLRLPLTGAEGRTWAAHPDERVDIAVVLTNARVLSDEGLEFNYFRQPDIAFSATMKELSVGPGRSSSSSGSRWGSQASTGTTSSPVPAWSRASTTS